MSVDEYTQEFEKLPIKCGINELEEQTIMRYLGGLEPKYANVVELQQFTMFDEVCVLAHTMEQQCKENPYKRDYPKPPVRNQPFSKGVLTPFLSPQLNLPQLHKKPRPHKLV